MSAPFRSFRAPKEILASMTGLKVLQTSLVASATTRAPERQLDSALRPPATTARAGSTTRLATTRRSQSPRSGSRTAGRQARTSTGRSAPIEASASARAGSSPRASRTGGAGVALTAPGVALALHNLRRALGRDVRHLDGHADRHWRARAAPGGQPRSRHAKQRRSSSCDRPARARP